MLNENNSSFKRTLVPINPQMLSRIIVGCLGELLRGDGTDGNRLGIANKRTLNEENSSFKRTLVQNREPFFKLFRRKVVGCLEELLSGEGRDGNRLGIARGNQHLK